MQWITIATPAFDSIEQFDKVNAQFDKEHDGLVARYVGMATDGKPRVIGLWESKAHADRFLAERLDPARVKALGSHVSAPAVVGVDVARRYVCEPGA
jgi:hypothetical protein